MLSQNKGTLLTFNPKSSSYCLIHKDFAQQLPAAIYLASAVHKATQSCFLLCHDIRLESSRWYVPLVLFLSNLHPAKLESEYRTKWIGECEGYHKSTDVIPLRYFRIVLETLRWDSLGIDWNLCQLLHQTYQDSLYHCLGCSICIQIPIGVLCEASFH